MSKLKKNISMKYFLSRFGGELMSGGGEIVLFTNSQLTILYTRPHGKAKELVGKLPSISFPIVEVKDCFFITFSINCQCLLVGCLPLAPTTSGDHVNKRYHQSAVRRCPDTESPPAPRSRVITLLLLPDSNFRGRNLQGKQTSWMRLRNNTSLAIAGCGVRALTSISESLRINNKNFPLVVLSKERKDNSSFQNLMLTQL